MRSLIKKKIANFISNFYFNSEHGSHILTYHSVSKDLQPRGFLPIYNISPEIFSEQIKLITDLNIKCGTIAESFNNSCKLSITFDDGYINTLENAAPILFEKKIPFTVFVTPKNIINHKNIFMTIKNLKELLKIPGAQIGSHGFKHIKLSDCSDNEMKNELINSKKWIEDNIGCEIDTFSFPYGAYNQNVLNELKKTNYKFALSTKFGRVNSMVNNFCLPRIDIWSSDTKDEFKNKIFGKWDWYGHFNKY